MIALEPVAKIMRQAAETVILPHFRNLSSAQIFEKKPGDLVTVADRESEAFLARELTALLPDSQVLGEESSFADPSLFSLLEGDKPVWIIDPIDGTTNFAKGDSRFAVIVALVQNLRIEAGWILEPYHGRFIAAKRGNGCWSLRPNQADENLQFKQPIAPKQSIGAAYGHRQRGTPPKNTAIYDIAESSNQFAAVTQHFSGGVEYHAMVVEEIHWSLHSRSWPWDHAAGVVMIEEAGGMVKFLDGSDYDLRISDREILAARNQQIFEKVQEITQ